MFFTLKIIKLLKEAKDQFPNKNKANVGKMVTDQKCQPEFSKYSLFTVE